MKLLTFEINGEEKWGVLINSEDKSEELILVPQMFEDIYPRICDPTSSFAYKQGTSFFKDGICPSTITDLLNTDGAMDIIREMKVFAEHVIFVEDQNVRIYCTYKEDDVNVKSPITKPRLCYGLVQNSTSFSRNNPAREHVNAYPQGHQRPIASVVGAGDYITIDYPSPTYGFNVEMGIIIGKKGKNIKARDAMKYVAGYTNVIDMQQNALVTDYDNIEGFEWDWFADATSSWMAKKQDVNCAVGPYLVTTDEIVNPYTLLAYTRENGVLRDRAHTSNTFIGVERLIEHYTSYATVYPGDILHLGTIGVDGKWKDAYWDNPETIVMEGEIEKLGCLKVPVKFVKNAYSTEDPNNSNNAEPASPTIREMIKNKQDSIETFDLSKANSFWAAIGNYKQCKEVENLQILTDMPRTLNNPASALTLNRDIKLSARSTDIEVSAELCFVLKKIARKVPMEKAPEYILGFSPMVSFHDQSFHDKVIEPASLQERNLPDVYARWADETNIMSDLVSFSEFPDAVGTLTVDGIGEIEFNTKDYVCKSARQIAFMTKYLTLLPGDVISLGRLEKRIRVTKEQAEKGITGKITMGNVGEFKFSAKKEV